MFDQNFVTIFSIRKKVPMFCHKWDELKLGYYFATLQGPVAQHLFTDSERTQ